MTTINFSMLNKKSVDDFCSQRYNTCKKPILFWDTCALLDIMRFFFQEKSGDKRDYLAIKKIYEKVMTDDIYSVSSEICIQELGDNYNSTLNAMCNRIEEIHDSNRKCITLLNEINNTFVTPYPLLGVGLERRLKKNVDDIINKTYFLKVSDSIAYNSLTRVIQKDPPASKKQEFKDCAIWETMTHLCKQISKNQFEKIFYTTNVNDFCYGENFHSKLVMESRIMDFSCCCKIIEVAELI